MALRLDEQRLSVLEHFKDDERARAQFNALTEQTFDFNFEQWYRDGYWGDAYQPCALVHEGQIVANVSVNHMHFDIDGRSLRAIQIGTAMVDPAFRGRGLARFLLERVLHRWQGQCELIYLFANDSVLDFYPRFGFQRVQEHEHVAELLPSPQPCSFHKVDMGDPLERQRLVHAIDSGAPTASPAMLHNPQLLMFYCTASFKDSVYYSPRHDAYAIVEFEDGVMTLYGVIGKSAPHLHVLMAELGTADTRRVVLGFTPQDTRGFKARRLETDETLFIHGQGAVCADEVKWRFPVLSHA
ncbi:GNAT family N-acetyltransferase [Pseudomonas sp. NPDC090755]|uniref:GNAT family N-acetyltransferase n=1 Tax=Pseudomonas sp. NPDC090755 TaxID=3364481 RepID=UPI00383B59A0